MLGFETNIFHNIIHIKSMFWMMFCRFLSFVIVSMAIEWHYMCKVLKKNFFFVIVFFVHCQLNQNNVSHFWLFLKIYWTGNIKNVTCINIRSWRSITPALPYNGITNFIAAYVYYIRKKQKMRSFQFDNFIYLC